MESHNTGLFATLLRNRYHHADDTHSVVTAWNPESSAVTTPATSEPPSSSASSSALRLLLKLVVQLPFAHLLVGACACIVWAIASWFDVAGAKVVAFASIYRCMCCLPRQVAERLCMSIWPAERMTYGPVRSSALIRLSIACVTIFNVATTIVEGVSDIFAPMYQSGSTAPATHVFPTGSEPDPGAAAEAQGSWIAILPVLLLLLSLLHVIPLERSRPVNGPATGGMPLYTGGTFASFIGLTGALILDSRPLDLFFAVMMMVMTITAAVGQLQHDAETLLLHVPARSMALVQATLRRVRVVEHVLDCRVAQCWPLHDGGLVANVRVRLVQGADSQEPLRAIRRELAEVFEHLTVEIERSE